ncbi:MAG: hypothetical protein J1F27_02465 [Prevotellaceae bacterium]|nr:hypothetical protein [Prevotellaceae bacterium]
MANNPEFLGQDFLFLGQQFKILGQEIFHCRLTFLNAKVGNFSDMQQHFRKNQSQAMKKTAELVRKSAAEWQNLQDKDISFRPDCRLFARNAYLCA